MTDTSKETATKYGREALEALMIEQVLELADKLVESGKAEWRFNPDNTNQVDLVSTDMEFEDRTPQCVWIEVTDVNTVDVDVELSYEFEELLIDEVGEFSEL
jgi:hypothetical protein